MNNQIDEYLKIDLIVIDLIDFEIDLD